PRRVRHRRSADRISGHREHLADRGRYGAFRVPSARAHDGRRGHSPQTLVCRGALRPLPRARHRWRSGAHRVEGTAMRLVRWGGDALLRRRDDVIAVHGAAMGYSTQLLHPRRGYVAGHTRRPDFQAVATLDDDDKLLGFGYGYRGGPGQWWHDQVRAA